jgi:DNA replication protein DnaC
MQQCDQSRTAFINEPEFLLDPGADLTRRTRQRRAYKLLIIDELGYVPLSQTGAELLFEVFSQRYGRGSTVVTSNLPFDEWTSVFGSERLTGALLDRLRQR